MHLLQNAVAAPAVIALLPAIVTWWRSRALIRRLDDPALPERLLSAQRTNGTILGISVGLLAINWTSSVWWSVPLLFLARLASTHQLRRALLRETWTLGAHLSFFVRLIVATFGFWVLLALAPSMIALDTTHQSIVTGILIGVLITWSARHTEVASLLLRARPIADPDLAARFSRLVTACGIPAPRFLRVDLNGGVFANAVALPSLRQSRVLFSDALLSNLDPDAIEAICAHELAHIEQFNPRRLRTSAVMNYTFIAFVATMPLLRVLSPSAAAGLPYAWPILLVVALALRARHRQHNETAADLRAIALTGNPEALARALTTLYAIAHIPRRYESQREQQATHPSLARRIKAIREAAGTPPASLAEAAMFTSGGTSAIFRDDALEWAEGTAARHSLSYAHITELRVDARRTGPAKIVAVEASGRRWELALADADVARAQAVMDIVDARTAGPPPSPPMSPAVARALAMAVAALATSLAQFSAALVAVVAALFPAAPLAAASALAALAAAGLSLRDRAFRHADPITPWFAVTIALAAIPLLALAHANRADNRPPHMLKLTALFGGFAALSWLLVFSAGFDLVRMHQMLRAWPSAAVFSFALAAVLGFQSDRVSRYAAPIAAVAGLSAVAIGSTTFLERFSTDRFVARTEPFAVRTISPRLLSEFSVPFDVNGGIRVSPNGRSIALVTSDDDEETTTFHVGRTNGPLTAFNADDAVFPSDDRVLLLERRPGGGVNLRDVDVREPARMRPVREITGIVTTTLSYNSIANEWMLLGRDRDGEVVRVTGHPTDGPVQVRRWAVRGGPARGTPIASSAQRALVVDTRYDLSSFESRLFGWRSVLVGHPMSQSRLWSLTAGGTPLQTTTGLELQCLGGSFASATVVCAAFDGWRTTIFTTDDRAATVHAVGWVAGRFLMNGTSSRGSITGWWQNDVVALDLGARVAYHIRATNRLRVNDLAVTDRVIAAVSNRDGRTTVTLYARRGDTMPGS